MKLPCYVLPGAPGPPEPLSQMTQMEEASKRCLYTVNKNKNLTVIFPEATCVTSSCLVALSGGRMT